MDSQLHTLSLSFDSSKGEIELYVDGVETDSRRIVDFENLNLASGGSLVLGQEQNSPQGNFDPSLAFEGTLYDLRIWNEDDGAGFIGDFVNSKIVPSNIPAALIANWQFDGLDGGTSIENIVDVSNPLSVSHIAEAGFSAGIVRQDLTVSENASDADSVGFVLASDTDSAETFTYRLLDNAAGRFGINAATGEITVFDSSQLDFENLSSHQITVEVTDSASLIYVEDFTIEVRNANDLPVVDSNPSADTDEETQLLKDLNSFVTDVDGDTLVYRLVNNVSNGVLNLNTDGTFDYSPATNFDGTDSFDFTVEDQSGITVDGTFSITVNPINDAMVVNRNTGATFLEGETGAQITSTELETTDVDNSNVELEYTVTTNAVYGELKLNGSVLSKDDTFTQADINAGLLIYDHFGGEIPTDSFDFSVTDGEVGSIPIFGTFDIAITQVNDVPIIGSIPPEDLVEDGFASGTLASFVTDNDPGFTHTYSLVTDTVNGELTLNPDGSFTYQPDPNFFGADSFEFIVDDGAGGTDTATYNFNVTPVNDDVSLDVNAGETFAEASVGNVISKLRLETTDVDNSESEIQYTVTTSTTQGEFEAQWFCFVCWKHVHPSRC